LQDAIQRHTGKKHPAPDNAIVKRTLTNVAARAGNSPLASLQSMLAKADSQNPNPRGYGWYESLSTGDWQP